MRRRTSRCISRETSTTRARRESRLTSHNAMNAEVPASSIAPCSPCCLTKLRQRLGDRRRPAGVALWRRPRRCSCSVPATSRRASQRRTDTDRNGNRASPIVSTTATSQAHRAVLACSVPWPLSPALRSRDESVERARSCFVHRHCLHESTRSAARFSTMTTMSLRGNDCWGSPREFASTGTSHSATAC